MATVLPAITRGDRLRALRAAIGESHRLGVTSVQNAGGSVEELELYDELRKTGELKVRVYYAFSLGSDLTDAEAGKLDNAWRRFPDDPLLKTGAIKIMVDGVIESYTAAMLAPYSTAPTSGAPMWSVADLNSQNQIAVWEANVGPERASRGWAYRSIASAGGRLAFGSDWPVVTLDPRFGVNMAVNRTTPEGTPEGGWHPKERVPLATALDAYTSAAAYASFDEQRKGTIAPGMLADLVVLTKDLFSLPAAKLLEAEVTVTIFDGKVVHEKK